MTLLKMIKYKRLNWLRWVLFFFFCEGRPFVETGFSAIHVHSFHWIWSKEILSYFSHFCVSFVWNSFWSWLKFDSHHWFLESNEWMLRNIRVKCEEYKDKISFQYGNFDGIQFFFSSSSHWIERSFFFLFIWMRFGNKYLHF